MINVQEVVTDPDMIAPHPYTILRSQGQFVPGGFEPNNTIQISTFGPVQQASDLPSIVNTVIQQVNNQLGYYLDFNNSTAETGEIALVNGNSFVANGSQTVTLGEGPTGINLGQPKQWLVIVDYNGRVGYVPEW